MLVVDGCAFCLVVQCAGENGIDSSKEWKRRKTRKKYDTTGVNEKIPKGQTTSFPLLLHNVDWFLLSSLLTIMMRCVIYKNKYNVATLTYSVFLLFTCTWIYSLGKLMLAVLLLPFSCLFIEDYPCHHRSYFIKQFHVCTHVPPAYVTLVFTSNLTFSKHTNLFRVYWWNFVFGLVTEALWNCTLESIDIPACHPYFSLENTKIHQIVY